MKAAVIVLTILICCADAFSQSSAENFRGLEWLVGDWHRTNAKAGTAEVERWSKDPNGELHGVSIRITGGDTTVLERVKLVNKDNNIYFVADVPENNQPVYFKLTQLDDDGFTCENPQHDFPKTIVYTRKGPNLKATIAGQGKSIEFLFEKKL